MIFFFTKEGYLKSVNQYIEKHLTRIVLYGTSNYVPHTDPEIHIAIKKAVDKIVDFKIGRYIDNKESVNQILNSENRRLQKEINKLSSEETLPTDKLVDILSKRGYIVTIEKK